MLMGKTLSFSTSKKIILKSRERDKVTKKVLYICNTVIITIPLPIILNLLHFDQDKI